MLGRILADAGAELTLAYVRHCTQATLAGAGRGARGRGAARAGRRVALGPPTSTRRVVVSASTAAGLRQLAEQEEADIVVFGSDYRTAPGHVAPQHSTQTLLEGGPARSRSRPPATTTSGHRGCTGSACSRSPATTPRSPPRAQLADSFGATLTRDEHQVDLLVVGSRLEAPAGRVMISAQAQNEIENATCPVLVVPRGVTLRLPDARRSCLTLSWYSRRRPAPAARVTVSFR